MTQTYEAWRITYQSSEQAARAAFERMMELEQGKCLHQIAEPAAVHPDDVAVDALAALMKAKLAKQRGKGYSGWDTDCTQEHLSNLLRSHVNKGDPVDVANFCAFLAARGEMICLTDAELINAMETRRAAEPQRLLAVTQPAPQAVQPAVPGHGEVLVTVSGFTGSGKSAIAGEIEIMCRALGLQVEWPDGVAEKNMAGADWQTSLELYKPRIRIVECNLTNSKDGHDN